MIDDKLTSNRVLETSVFFGYPKAKSFVAINNGDVIIQVPGEIPCAWYRFWQRVLLGFIWGKIGDEKSLLKERME